MNSFKEFHDAVDTFFEPEEDSLISSHSDRKWKNFMSADSDKQKKTKQKKKNRMP